MRKKYKYLFLISGLLIITLLSLYLIKTYSIKPPKKVTYMSKTEYYYDLKLLYGGRMNGPTDELNLKVSKINDNVYHCVFNGTVLDDIYNSNSFYYFTNSIKGNLFPSNKSLDSFPLKTYLLSDTSLSKLKSTNYQILGNQFSTEDTKLTEKLIFIINKKEYLIYKFIENYKFKNKYLINMHERNFESYYLENFGFICFIFHGRMMFLKDYKSMDNEYILKKKLIDSVTISYLRDNPKPPVLYYGGAIAGTPVPVPDADIKEELKEFDNIATDLKKSEKNRNKIRKQ